MNNFTRRDFLKQATIATVSAPLVNAIAQPGSSGANHTSPATPPNILLVISDQYRWDFICGYGRNPMDFTPNLDAMFRRGTAFENAFTNQPLCSPARSCLLTGMYANQTGVWRLGLGLRQDAVTLATIL